MKTVIGFNELEGLAFLKNWIILESEENGKDEWEEYEKGKRQFAEPLKRSVTYLLPIGKLLIRQATYAGEQSIILRNASEEEILEL